MLADLNPRLRMMDKRVTGTRLQSTQKTSPQTDVDDFVDYRTCLF